MKNLIMLILGLAPSFAFAASTLEVKKRSETEIRKIAEPILEKYCHEQCKILHIDTEVDYAVADEVTPGFEDSPGKATLAPASSKIKLLMGEDLGANKRKEIVDLLNSNLEELDYSIQIDTKLTKFPNPASSAFKVAELKDKVTHEVKASLQAMITQYCPNSCALGDFDLQAEEVSAGDPNYSSGQDYFQDGPNAIRVKSVKATLILDSGLSTEEATGIVEMAKLKVSQFKGSEIASQVMKFPKPTNGSGKNGMGAEGVLQALKDQQNSDSNSNSTSNSDSKENTLTSNKELTTKNDNHNSNSQELSKKDELNHRTEKLEHYEKIERVESGDAVQQVLDKFRVYGILFSAVVIALLMTLVAISFRRSGARTKEAGSKSSSDRSANKASNQAHADGVLTTEEKSSLIGKRLESENLYQELTSIYSEQPKVAKHVFTHVLTEEGVEVTAQYLEIFGESVVMDLLRDPGLQSDLTELMDFYARNTFDTNDDERLMLLKKLHHRTVSAKMQVYGSRSAVLFDFLADMDTPQITEMIKNESATVKAIVLTQCDQKRRQAIFAQQDEAGKLKLMTELSRIDHLPKNYIHNVATALRRKKVENPQLNTEALPGTDVLVSFMEKSSVVTQKKIIHQLMSSSSADVLGNLKSKLVSIETIRFLKDAQLMEIVTHLKHEEFVQFIQGCEPDVRESVLSRVPKDMAGDVTDELALAEPVTREAYIAVERKVLNRIKVLANQGQVNLLEVNERMFAEEFGFGPEHEVTASDMRRVG